MTKITLQLSSDLNSETGRLRVHDLKQGTFTLGRSPSATWQIIDETNHISGVHFELSRQDDGVLLTDLSSGGTSLDSPRNRLTKDQPTLLNASSVAYLPVGNVTITIEGAARGGVFEEDTLSPEEDYFGIENRRSNRQSAPPEDDDPFAGFDLEEDEPAAVSLFSEVENIGRGAPPPPVAPEPPARPAPPPQRPTEPAPLSAGDDWLDDDDDLFGDLSASEPGEEASSPPVPTPERTDAPPQRIEPVQPAPMDPPPQPPAGPVTVPPAAATPPQAGDPAAEEAIRALFGALAIDVDELSDKQKVEMAAEVGRSFHAMAEAIRRMLDTRREVKRTLGVPGTEFQYGANPLKMARDSTSAVDMLLKPVNASFLHGEEAVEDALQSMQSHQMALVGGIRTAIRLSLEAFDPDDLEKRFKKRGLAKAVPAMRKAELWERFVENYRTVADQVDSDIRMVIGKELDRLYTSEDE